MAEHVFSLEELVHVHGGAIVAAFNQAMDRAANDCHDRPNVKDARKVMLQVEIKPDLAEDGGYDFANAKFSVRDTIPQRKSKVLSLRVRGQHAFSFDDLSEEDGRQGTIDDMLPGDSDA